MKTIEVSADVNLEYVLPEISTEDLIEELEDRGYTCLEGEKDNVEVKEKSKRQVFNELCDIVGVNHLTPKATVIAMLSEYYSNYLSNIK